MKAIFQALIKKFEAKSLVSGDKGYRITLETQDLDIKTVDSISRLHRPDKFISVVLVDNDE